MKIHPTLWRTEKVSKERAVRKRRKYEPLIVLVVLLAVGSAEDASSRGDRLFAATLSVVVGRCNSNLSAERVLLHDFGVAVAGRRVMVRRVGVHGRDVLGRSADCWESV